MISDIRSDSPGHHGRAAADVDRATATAAGGPMPMSTRCYVLLNSVDSEVARLCPMSAKRATLRGCSALRSLQAEALR